ncbi:MAG: plasmid pRiA4b ORF-3 family protein [Nitriliruptoraceae bacterium]
MTLASHTGGDTDETGDRRRRYRLRVDLADTDPPMWRRLEVSGALHLDQLHDVLQVACGWTESHLHRFTTGPQDEPDHDAFLCPFDVREGDTGTPEERVRLDDVLREVGDRLFYQYDYGDDWRHVLELEAVATATRDAPLAVCVDGERPGPPEDCGGVEGYELLLAVADATHPEHRAARQEFLERYGYEVEPSDVGVVPFDREAINAALATLELSPRPRIRLLPDTVSELLSAVLDPALRRRLLTLIAAARPEQPPVIDVDTAGRMVHPYRWLLDRVGDDGIALTAAGYLPPVHVQAAFTELDLAEEWIGEGNRESDTIPVLQLRESAQELGLLRKYRGRLLVTKRGRALVADPLALWHHLAERMPLGSRDEAVRQAGVVLLLATAAGSRDDPRHLARDVLEARGWRHSDGTRLDEMSLAHILSDNVWVLRRLGVLAETDGARWPGVPTPGGIAFARAALQS